MNKLKAIFLKLIHAEMPSRFWCISVIAAVGAVIGGAALVSFVVDPYYRYREPFFYDKVYHEIYLTAPGILKREDYDLFYLGTSMTRNFFLEDIDKTFDCRSVKFAASGAAMKDLKKFFDVAKESKGEKLRRVILSLDIYSLNKKTPYYQDYEFMYRDDHREDYRYLFSRKTFSAMFYMIKRKHRPKRQRAHQADRNRMFATEYDGKPYGLEEVLKDADHNEEVHHTQTPYNPKVYLENLNGELLPMFDKNPDMKFIVYLAPYHVFTYCQSEFFGEADALIKQRTEVMRELLKRKNVELHDFQTYREFVCNHDNFCDVQHFSNPAAKHLLSVLKNRSRRIASEADIVKNEKELRQLISEYMPVYSRQLKEYRERKR